MLSTKLKHAFLTILQYSTGDGISSQKLSELLWPDKDKSKVKNSRGVTINHLRNILKEIDGIELIHEKGFYRIVISQNICYCDYLQCIELIESNSIKNHISNFINIIGRGKFLKSINSPEFDFFKEELEKKLMPSLLIEAEHSYKNKLFKITILFCKAIFYIDPINDNALYYIIHALTKLKMNNKAKKQYYLFINEYKKMEGEDYPIPLSNILIDKKQL